MNKLHTLTKIILSAIGFIFTIRLLSQLPLAIYWFYSTETKSVVKMERKNIAGKLVETEELMDFEKKTTDNNGHVTNNETSEDNENSWLDVQILLGISAVIIATVVIVFFMFRKQRIRK